MSGATRERAAPFRAALYARVSLADERQDPQNQLDALREFAAAKGWRVVLERTDRAGARDHKGRHAWRDLLAQARDGKFDLLVVWSLDRAFRSTLDALKTLELLNHEGVGFVCQRQPIDTTSPSGRLLFTMLAAVAEIERDMIRERTVAGMARARAQGTRIGRPPGSRDGRPRVRSVRRRAPA
jgi:DNA invertase Pin-like site-specific DNA recombinase